MCLALREALAKRRIMGDHETGIETTLTGMEDATMSRVKQASKRKSVAKATMPALGAAGLTFSLAGGASASAVPATDTPQKLNLSPSQALTLGEEEIADVSLATFHVFDKESQTGKRLACGCGGACCLFARAPSSALGHEVYSTQSHRQTGRAHKHVPKYP